MAKKKKYDKNLKNIEFVQFQLEKLLVPKTEVSGTRKKRSGMIVV